MRKITKTIAMVLLGTMLFSMNAFAAEVDRPVDEAVLEETQSYNGSGQQGVQYKSSAGMIRGTIKYSYTAEWEEGTAGWIKEGSFTFGDNIVIGFTHCEPKRAGSPWTSGGSYYQLYTINNVVVQLSLTCDEWGDVTMGFIEK